MKSNFSIKTNSMPLCIIIIMIICINFAHASDTIKLKNKSVDRCLNVHAGKDNRHGGAASAYSCASSDDQKWEIIPVEGEWIQLKNLSTSRCLNIHAGRENKEGGLVSIANCANTPDQHWQMIQKNNQTVQIKNKSTSRCLNMHAGRHDYEGAPVSSYTCNSASEDQLWDLQNLSADVGSVSAGLTGGFNDVNSRRRNATVRLERTNGNLLCSGVLISPTLVLSAGHCWDPSPRPRPAGSPSPFSLTDWETPGDWYNLPTGTNLLARVGSNDSLAGTTYQMTQYNITGNTDIIMFRLANPVPNAQAIPADVITTNGPENSEDKIREFLQGKTLRVAGWGGVAGGAAPRFRQTRADYSFTSWPENDFGPDPYKMEVTSASGAIIRGRDSGGPLYWQDGATLRLIGITQAEGRHVMTFFRGGYNTINNTPQPDIAIWINEQLNRNDCVAINSSRIRAGELNGRMKVYERTDQGNHYVFDFQNDELVANYAARAIRRYHIDQSCFVGRPDAEFSYLLVDGDIPVGPTSNESCRAMNASTLKFNETPRGWWITNNDESIEYIFFPNPEVPTGTGETEPSRYASFNQAHWAMSTIQRYQPRFLCHIGNPGMMYLRR